MLWLRAWLETRARIAFLLVWAGVFFLPAEMGAVNRQNPPAGGIGRPDVTLHVLAFVWVFTPMWLAGAGIRTQSTGFGAGAMRGLHGSTHYTLALPVSRSQLLLVRAALGFIETVGVICVFSVAAWVMFPLLRGTGPFEAFQHVLVVCVCATGFYGLSVLVATVLDEPWNVWVGTLGVMILWLEPVRNLLPAALNVFGPLSNASPLITHTLPWSGMSVAVVAGAVFLAMALKVVQTQEY